MSFNRLWRAAIVIALLLGLAAVAAPAVAEPTIQKVQNKSLTGAAYARLRNLTYAQCEERCLKDPQCVALEHHRGGVIQRSSNCALFSSVQKTADAQNSDVGFKRQQTAEGAPVKKAAPKAASRRDDSAAGGSASGPTTKHYRLERSPTADGPNDTLRQAPAASDREQQRAAAEAEARRQAEERRRAEEQESRRLSDVTAARQQEERRRAAEESERARVAVQEPQRSQRLEAPAPRSARPSAAPAPQREAEAQPAPTTRSARPPAVVVQPQPTARVEAAPPAASAPVTVERRAAAADERFHIVPVFYGTDRNQVKQQNRIGYANDRAKRLEMGRALISVPLDHKVPNIERPRAWLIPYVGSIQLEREDPNRHFTVREVKVLTKAELINLVRQRLGGSQSFKNQSIVFIHGYNTSFDEALFRTAQISYDLQFDGASFAYSWPSGGGLASYIYDRDSAQGAERYLYEFLQMVQNETGSTSVNIIAHSMGNQMLLQVLRSLRLRAPDAISKINQIILASPDVDRDAFEALSAEITGVAKGITLYASARDRALEASRFVAGNKPRAGDVPEGGPVIVSGIDTIDITQVSTDYLALHHSGYAEHSDLLTDIAQIIRTGTRPWERRLKAFKPVKLQAGVYWRYER